MLDEMNWQNTELFFIFQRIVEFLFEIIIGSTLVDILFQIGSY